ncbi:MAG: deoxynucleoside kinase [Bradymonadaceae bacterium]
MTQTPDPRQIIEVDRRGASQGSNVSRRKYIAVAGNIGAGKSSMVDFLCQRYDIQPFFEPNDENPYLEDFYGDMKAWSFASQIYFLTAKFRLHLELDATPHNVIQDRTIWEDAEIFAENLYRKKLMTARDYQTYRQLYEAIHDQIQHPDLMIYLRCPIRTVRKRIAIRGREMEQNIPIAYLRQLHRLYEDWIGNYSISPVVIIPTNKLDYLTDLVDCHDIMRTIEKYL